MNNKLIRSTKKSLTNETAHYAVTFGVIAVMLYVVGMPFYVIFFLGAFSFFLWKLFSVNNRNIARQIFDFYLSASEILREDGRKWYGFELSEVIVKGEKLIQSEPAVPPLVRFTLGTLYRKSGDYSSAAREFGYLLEGEADKELSVMYPTPGLREFVKTLRKIERSPAEAPLTSAAVRNLERLRKRKGQSFFEECHRLSERNSEQYLDQGFADESQTVNWNNESNTETGSEPAKGSRTQRESHRESRRFVTQRASENSRLPEEVDYSTTRKSISEVLDDIYGEKTN